MRPDTHDRVVLDVRNLRVHFATKRGLGKAVDGVSFEIRRGETLGLVGESGSGKSITALSLLRLNPLPSSRIVGGKVLLDGEDLLAKSESEVRRFRGSRIAMVFQDPLTALDPVFTIGDQLMESLRLHRGLRGPALRERAIELLRLLRIPDPALRLSQYPHNFSGGMRQRVVSAIALSGGPDVLIADEPTTSLDVTIQAAYLTLLRDIQKETGFSILFITHDFGVVAKLCDRVAVMYAGRIVETASVRTLLSEPAHPYTRALLESVPDVNRPSTERISAIEGRPPSIYALPVGCAFAPRCPVAMQKCRDAYPPEVRLSETHALSCWKYVDE